MKHETVLNVLKGGTFAMSSTHAHHKRILIIAKTQVQHYYVIIQVPLTVTGDPWVTCSELQVDYRMG